MPLVALALLAASVAPAAENRQAEVRRLLFEICPKIVAGEIDLSDRAQVAALGFLPRPGGGDWVRAQKGEKQRRITLGFRTFPGKRVCQVGFGGKDNQALYRSIIQAGEARGWHASAGAEELGGFITFLDPPTPSRRTIMFAHWPEFDGLEPATNAGLIDND